METTFSSMMNRHWHLWIVTGWVPGGHCVDCEIWLHSGAHSAGAEAVAVAIKNYPIILSLLCPNLELGSSWIPSNTL